MASFRARVNLGVSPGQAALLLCLAASPLWGQSASVLREVRYWTQGDVTRVALETSAEVEFTEGRLQNPERVFVDLVDTRPNREFRGLAYSIPVDDARVKQVRVALNTRGTTRVVVDLAVVADFNVSRLSAPDRIVIEVRSRGVKPTPSPTVVPEPDVTQKRVRPFVPPSRPVTVQAAPPLFADPDSVPSLSGAAPSRLSPTPPSAVTEGTRVPTSPARPATATVRPPAPPRRDEEEVTPAPAQRDRLGNRSLTRTLGLKLNRIVIDPGHGGHDHGTTSKSGVVEKEIVLDVAQRLGTLIREQLGAEVVFTRSDDTYVPLERRTQIANDKRADLFLSIHANSSPYPSIGGVETYYLSLSAPREDLETAARENAGAQRSIGELNEVVRKIALADKVDESREFAARIQSSTHELAAKAAGRQMRNRGVKKAPFVVLIGAEMPSVLTEIGFLTNPREESLLGKGEHRQKVADALFKGIVQYGQSLSHFRVARRTDD
ncbi:MAG: N-acetylmuramoyl-L-alanine amidase [Bryobacterales bacterium]|nr:N-acetylmuramoyl-L-alanine amidase [Bryobacterales bacterium]